MENKLLKFNPDEKDEVQLNVNSPLDPKLTDSTQTENKANLDIPENSWGQLDEFFAYMDKAKLAIVNPGDIPSSMKLGNYQSSEDVKGPEEFENAWNELIAENPEYAEFRDILTRISKKESNHQSIQNKAGAPAYGYFQLWETNLGGHSPEEVMSDPKLQIKLAIGLLKQNLRTFNDKDFSKAEELGYSVASMIGGSWLGGVGGVRAFLHENKNRTDSHWYGDKNKGASVGGYMDFFNQRFKQGGALPIGNKVKIKDKIFNLSIVEEDSEKAIGLSEKDSLPNDGGMLFIIKDDEKDDEGLVWFTMEDTKFPLDIIFIDKNLEVLQVSKGKPLDDTPIYGKGDYVLEVNEDSGITVGDFLEFETEKELNSKMLVLDSDGNVQMALEGGERVVSRRETKIIINQAKKAEAMKNDASYRTLGKYIFKVLERQDNNEPEYV